MLLSHSWKHECFHVSLEANLFYGSGYIKARVSLLSLGVTAEDCRLDPTLGQPCMKYNHVDRQGRTTYRLLARFRR